MTFPGNHADKAQNSTETITTAKSRRCPPTHPPELLLFVFTRFAGLGPCPFFPLGKIFGRAEEEVGRKMRPHPQSLSLSLPLSLHLSVSPALSLSLSLSVSPSLRLSVSLRLSLSLSLSFLGRCFAPPSCR